MLWDDRPEYPMVFWVELDVSGKLETDALKKAVDLVLLRHPLLTAGVEDVQHFPHWTQPQSESDAPTHPGPCVIRRPNDDDHYFPVGPQWNLSFRLTVVPLVEEASDFRFRFQFHHAAADGIASCTVIGDILATYDCLLRGQAPDAVLAPLLPERLAERGALTPLRKRPAPAAVAVPSLATAAPPPPPPSRTWSMWWYEFVEGLKFATTRPKLMARPRTAPRPNKVANTHTGAHECPFLSVVLSREETEQIRRLAEDVGGLNDVLLAWLFVALEQWRQQCGSLWPWGTYRVTVPANLRPAGERALPAANCISYAFLDRSTGQSTDGEKLLPGIAHATKAIVRYDLTRQFLAFLENSCRFPRWFRFNVRRKTRMSTTVLSYVGDPSRRVTARVRREVGQMLAGEMVVDRFIGAPPVRPNTRLAMAVTTYRDQLGIGATFDRRELGRDAAQEFLNLYVKLLLEAAQKLPAQAPESAASATR